MSKIVKFLFPHIPSSSSIYVFPPSFPPRETTQKRDNPIVFFYARMSDSPDPAAAANPAAPVYNDVETLDNDEAAKKIAEEKKRKEAAKSVVYVYRPGHPDRTVRPGTEETVR